MNCIDFCPKAKGWLSPSHSQAIYEALNTAKNYIIVHYGGEDYSYTEMQEHPLIKQLEQAMILLPWRT